MPLSCQKSSILLMNKQISIWIVIVYLLATFLLPKALARLPMANDHENIDFLRGREIIDYFSPLFMFEKWPFSPFCTFPYCTLLSHTFPTTHNPPKPFLSITTILHLSLPSTTLLQLPLPSNTLLFLPLPSTTMNYHPLPSNTLPYHQHSSHTFYTTTAPFAKGRCFE